MSARRPGRLRSLCGVGLVVAGAVLLAWLVVRGPLEDRETAAAQQELAAAVPDHAQVAAQPVVGGGAVQPVATGVAHGQPLAVMRIPRFGADWRWVALQGTDAATLADGPGHYEWTPLPGERGNVAFAAHRAGHGDPFIDFDRLRVGDRVEFRQGSTTWTYEIDRAPEVIETTEAWVLDPLPGHRLTLTTCWPKYGSSHRMYVRAHLVPGATG